MPEFVIEYMPNEKNLVMVKQPSTGWFYPNLNMIQAKTLLEKLNEPYTNDPLTIEEYFTEWENKVNELSKKEVDLLNLKEQYSEQEQKILTETDFKEIYGANNDKIRKNHINKELKPVKDAMNDLELSISYIKRRIDFIKNLMKMQGTLLEYGVEDD